MPKQNLTRAHHELFRRGDDERFASLQALWEHCHAKKEQSLDRWHPPQAILPKPAGGRLLLEAGTDGAFEMNDWSFGQLCHLAGVSKDTVNRLTPDTASLVFKETIPAANKPLQVWPVAKNLQHRVSERSPQHSSGKRFLEGDLDCPTL